MQEVNPGMQHSTAGFDGGWGGSVLALAQAEQPVAGAAPEQVPGVPGAATDTGTTSPGVAPPPATPTSSPGLLGNPFILVVGMLAVIVLTQVFGGRKDKKRRADLLSSLKRQDRVQTSSGIIGTIVDLRDDEVVLRVDEGTNTRIRFARSAISQVLRESAAKDIPQVETKPSEKVAV